MSEEKISAGTAKEIAEASRAPNPANAPETRVHEIDYAPMDLPHTKLAVPPLEGYFLYWHLGKNVSRALRHGYQFVDEDEVDLTQTGVANDRGESGNTDLGSRVSVSAGESGSEDEERLYLMKLPLHIHERHMKMKTDRVEEIAVALRAGQIGADGDPDRNKRYMKEGQTLFYPKTGRR